MSKRPNDILWTIGSYAVFFCFCWGIGWLIGVIVPESVALMAAVAAGFFLNTGIRWVHEVTRPDCEDTDCDGTDCPY